MFSNKKVEIYCKTFSLKKSRASATFLDIISDSECLERKNGSVTVRTTEEPSAIVMFLSANAGPLLPWEDQTQKLRAKIATVFRYRESRETTHYHVLPATVFRFFLLWLHRYVRDKIGWRKKALYITKISRCAANKTRLRTIPKSVLVLRYTPPLIDRPAKLF